MSRDYLEAPLGSINERRTAVNGLGLLFRSALLARTHPERLKDLYGKAELYLDALEPPRRDLYQLMLELACDPEVAWVPIARLAGSEERWHEELTTDQRYSNVVRVAERIVSQTGADITQVAGFIGWGADDETSLAHKGTMTMYLAAGDFWSGKPSTSVLATLVRVATELNYDIRFKEGQLKQVESAHLAGGSTTVWRLTYAGKKGKGKLVGGYVGG